MRRKYRVYNIECAEKYKVKSLKQGQFFKGNKTGNPPYIAELTPCQDLKCRIRHECTGLFLKPITKVNRTGVCGWVVNALDETWHRITSEKAKLEVVVDKL